MTKKRIPQMNVLRLEKDDNTGDTPQKFKISDTDEEIPSILSYPNVVEGLVVVLFMKGSAWVEVNLKKYEVKESQILLLVPGNIIQYHGKSEDFFAKFLFFTFDFIENFDIDKSFPIFSYVSDSPCLLLDTEDMEKLSEFHDFIRKKDKQKHHSLYKESIRNLLNSFIYDVCAIYLKSKSTEDQSISRKDELIKNLFNLILKNYRKERTTAFYANKLFLSPRYLSTTIKNTTGKTVVEWVDQAVILEAKSLLKSSTMTASQISDSLNFPNPSFFGRYFKRQTGMTPKEYQME